MKPTVPAPKHPTQSRRRPRGFALIVTLSLMILLTVIAVGLLSLSSISLRTSAQGDAMQAARANARLALMLAIGDLQKQLGPDTRISATADQLAATTDPAVSTTPQPQRQWAGAYKAWPAGLPSAARPEPEFLQWFVSGNPSNITTKTFAGTALPDDPKTSVEIVTTNTVGTTGDPVRVPLISQTISGNMKNNLAWWVSDLGTKALIAPAKEIPSALAEVRADQQVAPASNLKSASVGTIKPFASLAAADPQLPKVATWQTSALLADDPKNIRGLFHDLTPQSRGLLTNVRTGGFRKDLSMELERPASGQPSQTNANTALYKVGGESGINLQELWVYYNLYKEIKRSPSAKFTTGGNLATGTPFLQINSNPTTCQADDEFFMKQPVVTSYQLVLSFKNIANQLNLVADPIITMWNPLDIPVVITLERGFSVKYWQVPYDLMISKNGGSYLKFPLAACLSGATLTGNGDGNFVSLKFGSSDPGQQQLVFKPGEVIMLSQSGSTLAKSSVPDIHKLGGKVGFNFGSGFSVPVRDQSSKVVTLAANDTIRYKAIPNDLTAGSTATTGKSIIGGANHSRHFSVTHHEYYVGDDRGNSSASLGIGGMFIDYDFGDRRLKFSEDRGNPGTGITGTKKSGRLNATMFPNIFKTIDGTNTRDLPVSSLTSKQAFMLFSFVAKTEKSSTLKTRALSRFNPKALHVDFFDMSEKERDMLAYEYSVEPMLSSKNDKLDVTPAGNAFFGGGTNQNDGSSFVATHSVPREPIVSLAAFQHSFANGFDIQKPKYGYGTLNAREPMLPQISHAIGNSMACSVLASDKVEGTLPGGTSGRPMADHSYLANQALWDDWFLSGIAPQNQSTFSKSRTQKDVASDFLNDKGKLPVVAFIRDLRGNDPAKILSTYFSGTSPSPAATNYIASLIRVDGMFNVNSTSVEAWKSLLGGRKERPVIVRDATGKESIVTDGIDTPVAGLLAPEDLIAKGTGTVDSQALAQWTGRRALTETEIDALARGIVKEVRKRGPFLSLADFINRRVGSDPELARAGAIQSALDAGSNAGSFDGANAKINDAYMSGSRSVPSATSGRFAFKEAEQGPLAFGSPGIVKQADILTPIAPVLSARSDSFLIRGYGEKTDAAGKVVARAWCEAVVQRSPEFVDPTTDVPDKLYSAINTLNKTFGRRFDIVSFRWLNSTEV